MSCCQLTIFSFHCKMNIMPKKNGFTLIELLVVVAILAILSVIGLSIFAGTQIKARDTKRKADVEAISNALEAHYNFSTGYPALAGSWFVGGSLPKDPFGEDYSGVSTNTAGWTYRICADLEEDGRAPTDATPNDFCRPQQQ